MVHVPKPGENEAAVPVQPGTLDRQKHMYDHGSRTSYSAAVELQQLRSTQSILEDKGKCANKVIVTKTGEALLSLGERK